MLRALFVAASLIALQVRAEFPDEHPWPEVTYHFEHQGKPAQDVYWAVIDLTDGHAKVRVSRGGEDPDGPGKWQTTLMPVSKVAGREHFDIAINGDFFKTPTTSATRAEGPAAAKFYTGGIPAVVNGPAMTDGKEWATAVKPRPCLVVSKGGKLKMLESANSPKGAYEVIAGVDFLVQDGQPLFKDPPDESHKTFRGPNPRTAIGIDKTGTKLFVLVNDGRTKQSIGMSYGQLAGEMVKIGCSTAINLDGGGSATFVMRDEEGKLHTLNHPSDGHERPVANVLGITIK